MAALDDYVHLTPDGAYSQWREILERRPQTRQGRFTPIETILCCLLFLSRDPVIQPHLYGSASVVNAPPLVHQFARLFVRPPSSITSKMCNLEGSRPRGATHDRELFERMLADTSSFLGLYQCVLDAARRAGIGAACLPDFLELERAVGIELPSLEELGASRIRGAIESEADELLQERLRQGHQISSAETIRIVEIGSRIGQRAFADKVLNRFGHACGFCGMSPKSLPGKRLLIASHVKPWAASSNHERRDPRNGVAACPTHDAAFDRGLITVNGGLRVHRSEGLRKSILVDPGMSHNFGESLRDVLVLPAGAEPPGRDYLHWHNEHVFLDSAP